MSQWRQRDMELNICVYSLFVYFSGGLALSGAQLEVCLDSENRGALK